MTERNTVLEWKRKRDVAAEKEKELLRQTSDAVRFRQLQAMFSTVRKHDWQIATPEDVHFVRVRWCELRRKAQIKADV
jgi:hypothetical protein